MTPTAKDPATAEPRASRAQRRRLKALLRRIKRRHDQLQKQERAQAEVTR